MKKLLEMLNLKDKPFTPEHEFFEMYKLQNTFKKWCDNSFDIKNMIEYL